MTEREPSSDKPTFFPTTRDGSFPRLPVEALTSEGEIRGLVPGAWKFMDGSSLVVGTHSYSVMVDTADRLPEAQTGTEALEKPVIMRVLQQTGDDDMLDGYVVDCRHVDIKLASRDPETDTDVLRSYRHYKPVAPLAVAYTNKASGDSEMVGDQRAEATLRLLMEDVDRTRLAIVEEIGREAGHGEPHHPISRLFGVAQSLLAFATDGLSQPKATVRKIL